MKKIILFLLTLTLIALGAWYFIFRNSAPKVNDGDTVIINFEGYLGDKKFDGGSAENFALKVGSGKFVAGFEDQIVGMSKGEEKAIKVTFPKPYVPGLEGRDVIFKVKVVDINK